MLFYSSEFKHKVKLQLVKLKIWWILEPTYRYFWQKYVKSNVDDLSTSPLIVVEIIKEIIKGKKVCDLGCRKGFLLSTFAKYAREVIGVEKDEIFYEICKKKS